MSSSRAITRSWSVGSRTCTLAVRRDGARPEARIEWVPGRPERLTDAERAQYRAGRDAALREVGAELGLTVAVIEI